MGRRTAIPEPVVDPVLQPFIAKRRELKRQISKLKGEIEDCDIYTREFVACFFNKTFGGMPSWKYLGYDSPSGDPESYVERVVAENLEVPQAWICTKGSPTGYCVYDNEEDPNHDDCIFCHDPRERK